MVSRLFQLPDRSSFNRPAERLREEERIAAKREADAAKAEADKLAADEKTKALRQQREAERAKIAEEARLKMQREDEAARRREQRKAEDRARNPTARVASGDAPAVWRRTSPASTTPSTPVRTAATLPRPESPIPPKIRPGAVAGGGWREREAAKKAGAGAPAPPSFRTS